MLQPADLENIEEILQMIKIEPSDASTTSNLLSIYSGLMKSVRQVLQAAPNATTSLLQQFENYMDTSPQHLVQQEKCGTSSPSKKINENGDVEIVDYANIGVHVESTSTLSVIFVNPNCSNITGVAVHRTWCAGRLISRNGFSFRFINYNEQVEKLKLEKNLEVASFLPAELWSVVHAKGSDYLVFTVYAHDAMFVETAAKHKRRRPSSKVLKVSIPGFEGALPSPLPLLLANVNQQKHLANGTEFGIGCSYWNYSTWLNDGVNTSNYTNMPTEPVVSCYANHLKSFVLLTEGCFMQEPPRDFNWAVDKDKLYWMVKIIILALVVVVAFVPIKKTYPRISQSFQ